MFAALLNKLLPPAADTPIEEFTPTPAFPALQYLESVDEGGVAWQAGLRTGDFLIEVRRRPRWLGAVCCQPIRDKGRGNRNTLKGCAAAVCSDCQ